MNTLSANFSCLLQAVEAHESKSQPWLNGGDSSVSAKRLEAELAATRSAWQAQSVLLATASPVVAGRLLIALDGQVRRIALCPPDLPTDHLPYVLQHADVDVVIGDAGRLRPFQEQFPTLQTRWIVLGESAGPAVTPAAAEVGFDDDAEPSFVTEWILLTSGTTGRPKMVQHTLASLAGAIDGSRAEPEVVWGTFYDLRRYGGLQIFLRAVLTGAPLVAVEHDEPIAAFLARAAAAGVTHISGTPSHWRRVLMSPAAKLIQPRYIRLSGEIADQAILDRLQAAFPDAALSHAFATTEAGVAFDVRDGRAGFPAAFLEATPNVELRVLDDTLRIRSSRTAERYLGDHPPQLKAADGFVDTGDVVELVGDRYYFRGRRDGVINVGGLKVHPEQVEAVLQLFPAVHVALVKTQKNPITGALVVADVQLKSNQVPQGDEARALQSELRRHCRSLLAPHQVPVTFRFVPAVAVADTGKLVRHGQ